MKKLLPLSLMFVLLLSFTVDSAVLTGSSGVEKPELTIHRSDQQGITFRFDLPGVKAEIINHNGEEYKLLSIDDEGVSGEIGAPEVPLITKFFAIPDRARVKIA
ncbi:hypothetical protein ISS30_09425, partial [bacterium]|nr:hypothetical protein [bacterium]